ncbi:MAG: glycoside hydrolase family 9 protein [Candidatus Zhuqueibacterota bacterium]
MNKWIIAVLVLVSGFQANDRNSSDIFIRVNQAGYLPNDIKIAVLFTNAELSGAEFNLVNSVNNTIVLAGPLQGKSPGCENFSFCYEIDFTDFHQSGGYYLQVRGRRSPEFRIHESTYDGMVDSLLLFFKVQRCGFTEPLLHKPCHYFDATSVILDRAKLDEQVDVTGGWHDAGDYTKFLNTTAYATYTLLLAYQLNPIKFTTDADQNEIPDILDEAKIGLDWLLKLIYKNDRFIVQIQDLRDHAQGWRLPENDKLLTDRPAFVGIGKNLIGIYSATMALAYRIWSNIPGGYAFADNCLTSAENMYSIHNDVPDVDKSGSGGVYQDSKFQGKLALAAIELYLATGRQDYLKDAKRLADAAGSDYWWSWGDINAYAHYRIAKIDTSFRKYLRDNLIFFQKQMNQHTFGEATRDTWGSNSTILGVALQAILWKDLTGEATFDTLAVIQRDYILGRNQWGVSFIYNIGTTFSKNFHSQVAWFNGNRLPGAVAAGSISRARLAGYNIPYQSPDIFEKFQTDGAVYRDDRMDYVTNEPTITANATAVFVMSYFSPPY